MSLESTMSLVVAYYNSRLALWEPLVEPMEGIQNGKRVSTPWELKTKVLISLILILFCFFRFIFYNKRKIIIFLCFPRFSSMM